MKSPFPWLTKFFPAFAISFTAVALVVSDTPVRWRLGVEIVNGEGLNAESRIEACRTEMVITVLW